MLKEGVSDHCHERVSVKAVPGSALEVIEPKFFCRDAGTKDALQFLMTREITHMRAFTLVDQLRDILHAEKQLLPLRPHSPRNFFSGRSRNILSIGPIQADATDPYGAK